MTLLSRLLGLAACALPAWTAAASPPARLATVNDWAFLLQPSASGTRLSELAATDFDLLVVDPSADGSTAGEFAPAEVAELRAAGKIVLAYFSIGEAESYRDYFDPAWIDQGPDDPDAPAWLGPANPDFPDNYKVRYWDRDWQALLFGPPIGGKVPALDRILAQGFDGVYLDIIDAFDFWSVERPERSRSQAREDMVDLVLRLAAYARAARGEAADRFLVFPQNGESIVLDDQERFDGLGACYLVGVDGIGVEDVFFDELDRLPAAEVDFRTAILDRFAAAGRTVLSVDYVWAPPGPGAAGNGARYGDYAERALSRGFVPYAAISDRALDSLLILGSTGSAPPQPRPDAARNTGSDRLRRELALECRRFRRPA